MSEEKIMGFEEILGNEMVKDHFKKAIQNHKISHAYILTGEAGMGRKSIANAFAMTLLCEKGGSSGAERLIKDHRGAAVLCGHHSDHDKSGGVFTDDPLQMCPDEVKAA